MNEDSKEIIVGIHHRKGSFSDRWIEYCKRNSIKYKIVDCYRNDIIEQLKECTVLLWHWHHNDASAVLFARQLTYSLETIGKKVFPNSKTSWHFDDKIGQKYLLEAINAPFVPTHIFYQKKKALNWAINTFYPKVFKLSKGAGSVNVSMVHSYQEAKEIITKAFGRGFTSVNAINSLKDVFNKYKEGRDTFKGLVKGLGRVLNQSYLRSSKREVGYIYFQEFIPNNNSDTRIIVIGNRCFAIERFIRKDDFRASGSGKIRYLNNDNCNKNCITIAFKVSKLLDTQCLAYDFVFDRTGKPLIVEISYGFSMLAYDKCEGYWDSDLNWYQGSFIPQEWMIQDLINSNQFFKN